MNRDRNLLYGLLVRLFDFAPHGAVCAALAAAEEQGGRPLGELLRAAGQIDARQQAALDALVHERLSLPSCDAAQAVEELARSGGLSQELAALRGALDGQIAQGNATLPLPSATLANESSYAAANDNAERSRERFRILRTHAKGGLGEVFVARDEELRREVALKQLHERHADAPDNRARFLLEAEVTGGLEHPGIVPVYSLGANAAGRPYYAMRFIRGDSLKTAIDRFHQGEQGSREPGSNEPGSGQRGLELRKLLRRFVDVCNAIEYAHSRGVIHRDLKPDNVMLGDFGETLVVDWGLAKALGPQDGAERAGEPAFVVADDGDTARTQVGSAIGTPAYMSPEQAAGQLEAIGPASDIYSLGATLYCLLTGRPPFDDPSLLEMLLDVKEGDFPPPRAANPGVPAALEAICLKAMSLAPSDRYPSARALAEDVERWLADEPVLVYTAPWHERLARWGRRHRRSVEAAAAALAAITLVSVAAFVLIHGAKQEVERERDEVRQALAAETAAKRQAHAALAAEREAKLEARRAIDDYVKLVAEDRAFQDERLQPLRSQLLEDARRYYRQLIDQDGSEAHVRQELASAILRIGRISSAAGSRDEAIAAFEQALAAFQELLDEHPQVARYRSDLAIAHRSLGVLEGQRNEFAKAQRHFQAALEIERQLLADQPESAELQSDLAQTCLALGDVQLAQSAGDSAIESFNQGAELARRLVAADPQQIAYRRTLSGCYRGLSAARLSAGQAEAALAAALDDKRLWPGVPHELFAAACGLARCAAAEKDSALKQRAARETRQTLAEAIAAGFHDRKSFHQQPLFAAVLSEADYQALVAQLDAASRGAPPAK